MSPETLNLIERRVGRLYEDHINRLLSIQNDAEGSVVIGRTAPSMTR